MGIVFASTGIVSMTNDHPRLYPTSSPAPNATEATPADGTILVEDLIAKCHTLLNELEEFRSFITDRRQEHAVDIRQFHTPVISELKSLQKVILLTCSMNLIRPPHIFRPLVAKQHMMTPFKIFMVPWC